MRLSPSRLNVTPAHSTYASRSRRQTKAAELDFKPMTASSASEIRDFMSRNIWRTCDYTVGGMLMWADYFDYRYCIYRNTLFVKGISENHPGLAAFSLPLGELPLKEAVEVLARYCEQTGTRMTFSAVPAEVAGELAALTGGRVEALDGWSDYLYSASSLATLTGKAYSKKRNHVNRFMADNPGYRFEMISSANIGEARAFVAGRNVDDKTDADMAAYELQQCLDVIDNLDAYLFEGALLRDNDGRVCAVTFGEVEGDTLFVHIEKMNHLVAGAGETINKLFAEAMVERYPGLKYINREEDMGDPGLRYAKESYRPVALLDKCNVL